MKAGAVLVIAGVWVLCQVLGGQALQRLNVIAGGTGPGNVTNGQTGGSTGSGSTSSTPPGGVIGHGAV